MKKIVFTDGSHPLVDQLSVFLKEQGHEVWVNDEPITTKEEVRALLYKVGTPDVLILSEYAGARETLDEGDVEKIVAAVEKNITSAYLAARHFGTAMTERGTGSIIFLSSIFADKPTGSNPAYSISQGAMQMLMKELTLFYGNMGLRCNMIKMAPCPEEDAVFESDLVSACYDIETKVPTHIRTDAEDALGALLYFMSDMAKNLNGTSVTLDGGLLHFYFDRSYKKVKEVDL